MQNTSSSSQGMTKLNNEPGTQKVLILGGPWAGKEGYVVGKEVRPDVVVIEVKRVDGEKGTLQGREENFKYLD